ncbi:hypothetical protein AKJ16_DCAP09631 [Drosera capensis]
MIMIERSKVYCSLHLHRRLCHISHISTRSTTSPPPPSPPHPRTGLFYAFNQLKSISSLV